MSESVASQSTDRSTDSGRRITRTYGRTHGDELVTERDLGCESNARGATKSAVDGRRKDEQAAAMYARYQAGLSLAQVGNEFGVTRQSVYGMFAARGYELRRRPEIGPNVVYGGLTYTVGNTGYYRCTSGNRHLLHRRMWEDAHGPIPDGWDIHHLDENKLHNSLSNFECLPKAEHTRLYSPNCNQFSHKCTHRGAA